jgi:uncharacterized membrane protein
LTSPRAERRDRARRCKPFLHRANAAAAARCAYMTAHPSWLRYARIEMAYGSFADEERHPAPDSLGDVGRMVTLGVAAGLRTVLPLALLARHLQDEGPDIADGGWVLDVLTLPWSSRILIAGSAFEIVADKLPFVRSRVEPLPLIGRVMAGGTASALTSLAEGRSSDRGALYGSLGAVLGSVAGYWVRTRVASALPLPALSGLVVALAEDALAFMLSRRAVRRVA